MGQIIFGRTQSSGQTPFDNSTNGFISTDAQAAIEEAKATAQSSRYVVTAGYAGNAPNGTYLQWFRSNSSNTTPFPIAQTSILKNLSLAVSTSTTCTVTLLRNAVSVATISLTAQTSNYVTGLSVTLNPGDLMSVRLTSGTAQNPGFYMGAQAI